MWHFMINRVDFSHGLDRDQYGPCGAMQDCPSYMFPFFLSFFLACLLFEHSLPMTLWSKVDEDQYGQITAAVVPWFQVCVWTQPQDILGQCWRLKPSYEFHFEGLSNFSPSVEGLVQIWDVNPRIYKWSIKLILNLCMNYMVHVSSTMWRIKNQPSNSTSCSDNALCLLVLVVGRLCWGFQVTSSFSIWGCVLKGCFERGLFWRVKLGVKGIEDFDLEHWFWVVVKVEHEILGI